MDAFLEELRRRFHGAADFTERSIKAAGWDCTLLFIDGLTSGSEIADFVIRPLGRMTEALAPAELLKRTLSDGTEAASVSLCADGEDAETKLLNGCCVLVVPGAGAAAFEVKSGEKRGPAEPEVESTTRGPKDAFTETARTNTALLRRHLRSSGLRLWKRRWFVLSGHCLFYYKGQCPSCNGVGGGPPPRLPFLKSLGLQVSV